MSDRTCPNCWLFLGKSLGNDWCNNCKVNLPLASVSDDRLYTLVNEAGRLYEALGKEDVRRRYDQGRMKIVSARAYQRFIRRRRELYRRQDAQEQEAA